MAMVNSIKKSFQQACNSNLDRRYAGCLAAFLVTLEEMKRAIVVAIQKLKNLINDVYT